MTEIESLKILDIGIATFEESVTGSNDYETFEPVVALDNYDYEVAKWIANVELKRQRILVEKEIDRHERLSFHIISVSFENKPCPENILKDENTSYLLFRKSSVFDIN